MRIIKLAFISFVVFFGVLTAMSLLIPSQIRISKAINIYGTADSILFVINSRDQWPRWHPAFQGGNNDSMLRSANVRIMPVKKNDSLIAMSVQQAGRNSVLNSWQVHQFAAADSVTLQWYMDFRLPWYPWQKFGSLFYENTYGHLMEQGLQNIKNIVQPKKS